MDPSRCFVKDVKRVIIQVGTTVATRSDGRLAVGRIGCLSEQIKDLNSQGYEVILVNSGAVDIGHQRLRYRRLVNTSFTDLQKPQLEFDGKACAAVGQNGLIGLYDALFTQLDMASSHIFVADKDFDDPSFRMQLSETLNSLLSLKAIPIFNENDAIRTRRAPYEDTSDIFWDNDRLASLLAMALKADLLILLSDVEGLYSGPPSKPDSKIIHTYVKEVHQSKITFGDKSRIGRDGMTAKVEAAVCAVSAGIPVVISSGFAADDILKVLKGEKIGTLFHRDAEKLAAMEESSAREMAISARQCSRHFQNLTSEERKKIMLDVANALEENEGLIIAENQADVVAAKLAGYDQALVSGLTLIPGKIASLAKFIPFLDNMEEPIGGDPKRTEISDGLLLKKTSSPLGVFLFVVESSPKDLVLIASLALRSGRGLLLKGGKEAAKTNAVLHKVITDAIPETVGKKLIGLVPSREEIPDLLKLDDVIDLVIPRGSNEFIFKIKENTKIRLLGHSGGISHVYIDKYANMETAKIAVLNARTEYPAACNAIETLLVHKDLVDNGEFNDLITALKLEGVNFYGGPRAWAAMGIPEAKTFHHEYNSLDCSVEIVDDVTAAINLIRNHGSSHANCIITKDRQAALLFIGGLHRGVRFHNTTSRLCDRGQFWRDVELAISTRRIHARGPGGWRGC